MEENVCDIINGYAFSWDVVMFLYKLAYYYQDVLIGTAVPFIEW